MKITELMHGDWVSVNGWPVKVVSIGFDLKEETDDEVLVLAREGEEEMEYETYYASALEPIPLTPDMLLTNGFELQEMGGDRVALWTGFGEDNCHDIEVEFDGDKPIHLKIDGPVYLTTPNIKYLHQLQHFLRDCETGKEIEL